MATKDNHTSSLTKGQSSPKRKGDPPTQRRLSGIRVRTTCNVITDPSRLIVLKHTEGRVLNFTERGLLLDFGLMAVCILPGDSPLIEFVNGS